MYVQLINIYILLKITLQKILVYKIKTKYNKFNINKEVKQHFYVMIQHYFVYNNMELELYKITHKNNNYKNILRLKSSIKILYYFIKMEVGIIKI